MTGNYPFGNFITRRKKGDVMSEEMNCQICEAPLTGLRRKYCSDDCHQETVRAKARAYMVKRKQTPEYMEYMERTKESRRAYMKEYMKEYRQRDYFKEWRREYKQRPGIKERENESKRKYARNNREAINERARVSRKERYRTDPEYREKAKARVRRNYHRKKAEKEASQ